MEKEYLSKEKYHHLKKELEQLKTEGRRIIAERLKTAKDLGDLSENSDYQEARDEQFRLEQKISNLEEIFRNAIIVSDSNNSEIIRIGSKIKIKKNGELIHYTIVGSNEADPQKGFISNSSPVGKALIGKKTGEEVVITTPRGEVKITVVSID